MTSRLWILTMLIYGLVASVSTYDNVTSWKKGVDRNELEDLLSEDVYMLDSSRSCKTGNIYGCLQNGASSVILHLMNSARKSHIDDNGQVTLVKTSLPSSTKLNDNNFRPTKRTITERNIIQSGFLGFLFRAADKYLRTTGLVVNLDDDLTEGGLYRPRFVDEIYSEIDTLEDKNAKPNRRYEFKKLFIPLLVILKIFKLKLLVFLPILLGLASFKKIIVLLILIIPGIIGYLKLCKPDLGHTYGTYGHSSFYNSPPSAKHKRYQEMMQHLSAMNHEEVYAHQMAYHSYRNV